MPLVMIRVTLHFFLFLLCRKYRSDISGKTRKSTAKNLIGEATFFTLISLSAAFLGSALPNDVADSDEGPDEDSEP